MADISDDVYNNQIKTPQEIYDSYNNLVFSTDTRVIQKMITKIQIYNSVKHLNGDIFEFGVFKGASLALWLQLIKLHEYNGLTSVVGFDFFDKDETLQTLDSDLKSRMSHVIDRAQDKDEIKIDTIRQKCQKILPNRTILIKGDACDTSLSFKNQNPGARIKLLYLDMDIDKPTYAVLTNLWSKVVPDGIVVLDEYGFHKWDESNAVDRFLTEIKGQYTIANTNVNSPTMTIKKCS